ncbi:rho GTPase-activating protein gacV-like [Temnothorax curvispinosus]|uniref:Rho GTPase-activating protein gacV-like n=1 Tax=Temnothorax curvispinosus TaxID=300111 RepID=A0A6J1R0T8_9HYME|nr:rho GTPase-activating protein gacV-like [Temnothorax curvispinosus]
MEGSTKIRGTVEIDVEAIEKVMKRRTTRTMKNIKEEMKELREEVEILKRKVYKMEQVSGKRKKDESKEREEKVSRKKWWYEEKEEDEEEKRRKNVIIRVEKNRWGGNNANWKKVKQLFTEGLRVKVEVKEVIMIGQRGDWLTFMVKLRSEEDKWRILEARRKEGSRMKVKIDEDKWNHVNGKVILKFVTDKDVGVSFKLFDSGNINLNRLINTLNLVMHPLNLLIHRLNQLIHRLNLQIHQVFLTQNLTFNSLPESIEINANNLSDTKTLSDEDYTSTQARNNSFSIDTYPSSDDNIDIDRNVTSIVEVPVIDKALVDSSQNMDYIKAKLGEWAVTEKISHNSLKKLLTILKSVPSLSTVLPCDPHTLLQTAKQTNI